MSQTIFQVHIFQDWLISFILYHPLTFPLSANLFSSIFPFLYLSHFSSVIHVFPYLLPFLSSIHFFLLPFPFFPPVQSCFTRSWLQRYGFSLCLHQTLPFSLLPSFISPFRDHEGYSRWIYTRNELFIAAHVGNGRQVCREFIQDHWRGFTAARSLTGRIMPTRRKQEADPAFVSLINDRFYLTRNWMG